MTSKKEKFYDTHFEAFLAFAEAQDSGRLIDHSSWCHCAIGNYHDEASSIPPKGQEHLVKLNVSRSPLLEELALDHSLIYECLNNGYVPDLTNEEYNIYTYRGLAAFMRDFQHESYDYVTDQFLEDERNA